MGEVVSIHQKRFFTLQQAKDLLPVVRRITEQAQTRVKLLSTQIKFVEDALRRKELERRVYDEFQLWQQKAKSLGCDPKGMWLIDFDAGDGYYCWRFPEEDIGHFHGYAEGYRGRVRIQ